MALDPLSMWTTWGCRDFACPFGRQQAARVIPRVQIMEPDRSLAAAWPLVWRGSGGGRVPVSAPQEARSFLVQGAFTASRAAGTDRSAQVSGFMEPLHPHPEDSSWI